MDVFKYSNYRLLIQAQVAQNAQVKGYHGKLAAAAGCQSSYFSRMLAGQANLNSDQALGLALFWGLTETESDYFLLLVEMDRTSFGPMKDRLKRKLNDLKTASQQISSRLQSVDHLDSIAAETYYSSWQWIAIHIIVGIEEFRNSASISRRLNLPPEWVEQVLQKLHAMKLIEMRPDGWKIKGGHVHLPNQSPLTTLNHMNWRQKAMTDAAMRSTDNLHYTSVQSHSVDDFYRIRDQWLESVDKMRRTIAPSKDEELSCICLDFFKVY